MATIKNYTVAIREGEKVREYYREKKGLFGLITYRIVERTESLGKDVSIHIPELRGVDKVFINGDLVLSPHQEEGNG